MYLQHFAEGQCHTERCSQGVILQNRSVPREVDCYREHRVFSHNAAIIRSRILLLSEKVRQITGNLYELLDLLDKIFVKSINDYASIIAEILFSLALLQNIPLRFNRVPIHFSSCCSISALDISNSLARN